MRKRLLFFLAAAVVLTILGSIPVKIAWTQSQFPQPQGIFMLGGDFDRDRATVKFAKQYPHLPVWISTGSRRGPNLFAKAKIDPNRVHYDYRATDTVTNFTTMVERFQNHHIRHFYLITSDYHMTRSKTIATIVFGSRGIIVTSIEVPSQQPPETLLHVTRDLIRSIIWLFTGRTGASLNPSLGIVYPW